MINSQSLSSIPSLPLPSFPSAPIPHLRDEELAGGELPSGLLHLAVALQLHVLQLAAALHHALHFRLDLADVEASNCELLLNRTANLHRLRIGRKKLRLFSLARFLHQSCATEQDIQETQ